MKTRQLLYKRGRQVLNILICVLLLLTCVQSTAFTTADQQISRVSGGSLTYAVVTPMGGSWNYATRVSPVVIGLNEEVTLVLSIGEDVDVGETLWTTIDSDALDLSNVKIMTVVEKDGTLFAREITASSLTENQAQATLVVDSMWLGSSVKVYVYVSALRIQNNGSVTIKVFSGNSNGFDAEASLKVGSYRIKKQGAGAGVIEQPAGLSGMSEAETVYIICRGEKELIRVLLEDGIVMGLAIKSDGVVAGVEYDISRKVYINTLTKKTVLTKDELLDIFHELDFSFMKAPDETKWLQQGDSYSWSRTLSFL